MKRTTRIDLSKMRKQPQRFVLKPLALAVATASLMACGGSQQQATAYQSVDECKRDNPSLGAQCEQAYDQALSEAARSGPKYRSERDCVAEFGANNCVPYSTHSGNNWFMPAMAGFLLGRALDRPDSYYSSPLYTSYSRYSPAYGRWTTVDGRLQGAKRSGAIKTSPQVFKPKPTVTRTISRGGFGSSVAAKSSWGGSRGGWGG